jgi:hypothetical protein
MRARWGLDAPRALHRQVHDALQQMHTSAKIWLPVNQAEADANGQCQLICVAINQLIV